MLEKSLQEEVLRFNSINRYTKKLMGEQAAPPPTAGDEELPPTGEVPPPPTGDVPPPPPGDTPLPPSDPMTDPSLPASGADVGGMDTEEMDITDLVNMTTSIKKDIEAHTQDNGTVIAKMDDAFAKLNDLEQQLTQMNSLVDKIDQLSMKMDSIKEKTPQEKLEMRSLDSYPFNQNPQQFFAKKQEDMRTSGKNEYVLTKDDIQNYSNDSIKTSFNPEEDENEPQF